MSYNVEKTWNHKSNICVVVIITSMGHRCGYVGIDKDHPLYGYNYNDTPDLIQKHFDEISNSPIGKRGIIDAITFGMDDKLRIGDLFDVHGGITYSNTGLYPIEIWDEDGKYNPWWFGYDCAHAGDGRDLDVMPEDVRKFYTWGYDPVRSLEYCIQECESLSDQLEEYKSLLQ
jgi:hypothetical protein